jgi:protein TonB
VRRAGVGTAIGILSIAIQTLPACGHTGAANPPASPTTTVTAARTVATTAEGDVEPSGGTAQARAIALARFTAGDQPVYPEMSRRLQEDGTVELRIELLGDGSVRHLAIARSSGHHRLDAAALEAARTWRFNPRTGFGEVETIQYRVVFRLVD